MEFCLMLIHGRACKEPLFHRTILSKSDLGLKLRDVGKVVIRLYRQNASLEIYSAIAKGLGEVKDFLEGLQVCQIGM